MHPNPGNQFQILTTANDITTKLAMPMKRRFVLTGTGIMQWYNLGDTSAYGYPLSLEFVNNTPEFVGVRSNSAVDANALLWMRVPPRATLVCTLISGITVGSAPAGECEGTWAASLVDPANFSPRFGLNSITDFVGAFAGNTYYSEGGGIGAMSTGSAIMNTANDPSGRQGIARLQVAGVASYALFHIARYAILGGAAIRRSFGVSKSNANAAVNETTMRYGLGSNLTGGAHVDGVYFLNDFTAYGNFYVCRTIAAAGGNDTFTTAVAPAVTPNYDTLSVEVASGGTRVDYFINRALVRTHATAANIPSGIALATMFGATKVANTSSRDLYADWAQVQSYPTTLR